MQAWVRWLQGTPSLGSRWMNLSTESICLARGVAGAMPSKSPSLGAALRRGTASELISWERTGAAEAGIDFCASTNRAARINTKPARTARLPDFTQFLRLPISFRVLRSHPLRSKDPNAQGKL